MILSISKKALQAFFPRERPPYHRIPSHAHSTNYCVKLPEKKKTEIESAFFCLRNLFPYRERNSWPNIVQFKLGQTVLAFKASKSLHLQFFFCSEKLVGGILRLFNCDMFGWVRLIRWIWLKSGKVYLPCLPNLMFARIFFSFDKNLSCRSKAFFSPDQLLSYVFYVLKELEFIGFFPAF